LDHRAEVNLLRQIISLANYHTAPKLKVTSMLEYHRDVYRLHSLCNL